MISRRALLASAPACFVAVRVAEARVRPFSAPDPGNIYFEYPPATSTLMFNSNLTKTPRSVALTGGESTLVMICAGQSLVTSIITDTFNPTNGTKLDNYAWYDGRNYVAANPMIGTSGSAHNFNFKIADGIISNGKFARVIVVPMAISGTAITYWANDGVAIGEPSGYYRMIRAAAKKLAAQGITPSTPNVKFLIKWNQGESDTQQSTTQANYTADFNKMFDQVAVDLPGVKWMVAKETRYIGNNSAAVQAAQIALVNGTTIFAGEDMDSIGDGSRLGDQTHLTAAGGNTAVTMGIAAITAITF